MFDVLRSTNMLASNDTGAESSFGTPPIGGYVSSFNSNGFTLTNGSTNNTYVNENTYTYVGWCWDAGSTTSTNNSGSIQSTVRVNATAGFSVSTFTSPSSGAFTFGHGLGVAPAFHIVKIRNASDAWYVYHSSLGAGKYLRLNLTNAETASTSFYNNTAPTSSVITLNGSTWGASWDFVCYAFSPVAGYSSFGSFDGNSSTDGVFIYTGFRPRWVMMKRYDGSVAADWRIIDTARSPYNVADAELNANLSDAESTVTIADILSNGFKLRTSANGINGANSFIYAAFAEAPFQYALLGS